MIIPIFFLTIRSVFAQTQEEQLAREYIKQGEFEKALDYCEKLYQKNPVHTYFKLLFDCYIGLDKRQNAEKLALKQYKLTGETTYLVEAGKAWLNSEKHEKSKEFFEEAIKKMLPLQQEVIKLYQEFVNIKEFDYALKTLEKGRKILGKDQYLLNNYFAQLYFYQKNYPAMVKEYLDLLLIHESFAQSVQSQLENAAMISNDAGQVQQAIESSLIEYIQKYPDLTVFPEMLIWNYLQTGKYDMALLQAKALDKRLKEPGNRIMSIGQIAMENNRFEIAKDAFRYVVNKGSDNPIYISARFLLIQASFEQLKHSGNISNQHIAELKEDFRQLMHETGYERLPAEFAIKYAEFLAFYSGQPKEAIAFLQEYMKKAFINPFAKATVKMYLADIYLYFDDMWEASLLYSQIEKDFKQESLADEAKFKNAMIAFFAGDFIWAKTQLDVLKAATSELISNDALELSVLIQENLSLDSNTTPLFIYAQSLFLKNKLKYRESLAMLDTILENYTGHILTDEAYLEKARIYSQMNLVDSALHYYQKVITLYPYEITADNAVWEIARLYEKLGNKEKAMEFYKKLFSEYPMSVFVPEARERFRILRGDKVFDEMNKQLQQN